MSIDLAAPPAREPFAAAGAIKAPGAAWGGATSSIPPVAPAAAPPLEAGVRGLEITETAREQILAFLAETEGGLALRLRAQKRGIFGPEYEMCLVGMEEKLACESVRDGGGFPVLVDAESEALLAGTRLDFAHMDQGSGFKFHAPPTPEWDGEPLVGPLPERVRRVIDMRINPGVASHKGYVSLVEVRERVAFVRMGGGCQGCGLAGMTMAQGVREILMKMVPDLADVEDVTDHAAGTTPFVL
ncbi:MAG TPA: NifU family protein [Longimicrobiaceae bacterium]|jgi:Fe/S biogenesis protein NfuA|nr:NifU family protein [Longimicrobiaceae bacterium]